MPVEKHALEVERNILEQLTLTHGGVDQSLGNNSSH